MAAEPSESVQSVRDELAAEREQLAQAVGALRESADLASQLRPHLPLLLAGAFAVGFVLAGGVGATMRLLFRRGREGHVVARVGRFVVVER